jgi:hypothetical protein
MWYRSAAGSALPAAFCLNKGSSCERTQRVAEKLVLVGVIPEVIAIDPGDQAVWYSNAGNLKIEFDANRCPFTSNVLQAPPGVRLQSGTTRPGTTPGSYRYKLFINDAIAAQGEVLIRGK